VQASIWRTEHAFPSRIAAQIVRSLTFKHSQMIRSRFITHPIEPESQSQYNTIQPLPRATKNN
jgi:hypothetical protein